MDPHWRIFQTDAAGFSTYLYIRKSRYPYLYNLRCLSIRSTIPPVEESAMSTGYVGPIFACEHGVPSPQSCRAAAMEEAAGWRARTGGKGEMAKNGRI